MYMIPHSRNDGFIGESQSYLWLEKKYHEAEFNTETHRRFALWGLGGLGYVNGH